MSSSGELAELSGLLCGFCELFVRAPSAWHHMQSMDGAVYNEEETMRREMSPHWKTKSPPRAFNVKLHTQTQTPKHEEY